MNESRAQKFGLILISKERGREKKRKTREKKRKTREMRWKEEKEKYQLNGEDLGWYFSLFLIEFHFKHTLIFNLINQLIN